MSILVTTPATSRPISVDDVKNNSRIAIDDDDLLIRRLIDSAVTFTEYELNSKIGLQTITWTLDYRLPASLVVPVGPLISVTSIEYVDSAGQTQTLSASDYVVDINHSVGRVYPAYNVTWPIPRYQKDAVTVIYVAGNSVIPAEIKTALLLLVGHWYENPNAFDYSRLTSNETPMGYRSIISPYKEWIL